MWQCHSSAFFAGIVYDRDIASWNGSTCLSFVTHLQKRSRMIQVWSLDTLRRYVWHSVQPKLLPWRLWPAVSWRFWRSGQSLVRWTTGSLCRCLPKAQPVENWNTQAKGSKGLLSHEDQVTRKRSYIKLIQIFFEYGWMHRYFASVPRAKGLAWVALLCWKWFRDELALKKVCCCKRRCHRMWKPELWVCKRFSTKNRRRFQVAFSLWLPLTNEEAGSFVSFYLWSSLRGLMLALWMNAWDETPVSDDFWAFPCPGRK